MSQDDCWDCKIKLEWIEKDCLGCPTQAKRGYCPKCMDEYWSCARCGDLDCVLVCKGLFCVKCSQFYCLHCWQTSGNQIDGDDEDNLELEEGDYICENC